MAEAGLPLRRWVWVWELVPNRTGSWVTASHTLPGEVRPWGNNLAHSECDTLFEKSGL